MDETVIDITAPNIITIVLMVLIGFSVLGFAAKGIAKIKAGSASA